MAATRFVRRVPEPLASFVHASEDLFWGVLHVQVRSALGTRIEQFTVDLASVDQGWFLTQCYETHIRLNREEKTIEDLLR